MSKITERNTDASTIATWGSVSISPTEDVVVGSFATWTLTCTVGAYAMDVGGGLKIGTRRQADFGAPQFDDPSADNYTSVPVLAQGSRFETTFDPRGHKRPFNAVAVIRLVAGPLYPGDTVTVVLGDRSRGSRGLQVQSFPESASDFAVFVDPLSSGEYKRVYCTSPNFRIRSGPADDLHRGGADHRRGGQAVPRPGARQRQVRQPDAGRCAGTHPGRRSAGRREPAPGERPRDLDRRGHAWRKPACAGWRSRTATESSPSPIPSWSANMRTG